MIIFSLTNIFLWAALIFTLYMTVFVGVVRVNYTIYRV